MSDELEEEKDALDDDELQEDFGDDMPEDEELEGSEDGEIFDEDDDDFSDDDEEEASSADVNSDDDDDDDEVEADLTAILEDRIKANDDENPEEGESAKAADGEDTNVVAKQEDETVSYTHLTLPTKA